MIFFPSNAILRDCVRETPDQRGDAETREAGDRVDEDERERVEEEERKEEEEEEEIILLAGEGGAAESAGDRRRRRRAAAEAEAEANGRRANAEENRSALIVGWHTRQDNREGRGAESIRGISSAGRRAQWSCGRKRVGSAWRTADDEEKKERSDSRERNIIIIHLELLRRSSTGDLVSALRSRWLLVRCFLASRTIPMPAYTYLYLLLTEYTCR